MDLITASFSYIIYAFIYLRRHICVSHTFIPNASGIRDRKLEIDMDNSRPFLSEKEMTGVCLSLLDGLCATYIGVRRSESPDAFRGHGASVPESQIELYLGARQDTGPHEGFRVCLEDLRRRADASPGFPLAVLFRRLEASGFQQLLVIMALAPELDRKYERIFSFLQENSSEKRASVGLAVELYRLISPVSEEDLSIIHDEFHPLNRFVLVPRQKDGKSLSVLSRPLVLRRAALNFLLGGPHIPAILEQVCEMPDAGETGKPLAGQALIDRAVRLARHFVSQRRDGTTGILELWGPPGSGKRFILDRVAKHTGSDVLCLDFEALPRSAENRRELIEEAAAHCYHIGAIPAVINFDTAATEGHERDSAALRLVSALSDFPLIAVCGNEPRALRYGPSMSVLRLTLPFPDRAEQQVFWTDFASRRRMPLSPEVDTRKLVAVYSLTPGQIRDVLSCAEAECISLGLPHITSESISNAVRSMSRPKLSALASLLPAQFSREDLILEPETERLFTQLRNRIQYRFLVGEEWGFDGKLPYGRGISVLLYGPPGTGKTMSAQVLAAELGLDAYRIDLSRIIDK
jgi:hypothetical protein